MCDDRCPIRRRASGEIGSGEIGSGETRVAGPTRRQFLTQSALAAIAAVLTSACGDGGIGGVGPGETTGLPPVTLGQSFTIRLADYPALQQAGGIAVVNGSASNPIAVSRIDASTFVALSLMCPHTGYKPLSVLDGGFECPNHNALFGADGRWVGGPRTKDLQSYPTAYDARAGTVKIG